MISDKSQMYESLIEKGAQQENQTNAHSEENKGPLLGRIEEIKTSKDFLEECTYFIGLDCNIFQF